MNARGRTVVVASGIDTCELKTGPTRAPFYPATALELAGARVDTREFFTPYVVQDRELITGQNPPSNHAIADLFVKALDRCSAAKAAA